MYTHVYVYVCTPSFCEKLGRHLLVEVSWMGNSEKVGMKETLKDQYLATAAEFTLRNKRWLPMIVIISDALFSLEMRYT